VTAVDTRPPRRDDRAHLAGKSASRGPESDVHHWLERYLAWHDGADPSDPLAGVPFN
jgi:hypothetical protein